jgi:hypothetical protein
VEVLPRQIDALHRAFAALDGVGEESRTGEPDGVHRLLQPLAVKRPVLRQAIGARDLQTALVRTLRAERRESLALGEEIFEMRLRRR